MCLFFFASKYTVYFHIELMTTDTLFSDVLSKIFLYAGFCPLINRTNFLSRSSRCVFSFSRRVTRFTPAIQRFPECPWVCKKGDWTFWTQDMIWLAYVFCSDFSTMLHFCACEMFPGWGHLITWMDPSVGHLNGILARVGGNLNNNFQKSQVPGGLPGGGGHVEASIWPIH